MSIQSEIARELKINEIQFRKYTIKQLVDNITHDSKSTLFDGSLFHVSAFSKLE